jgi:SAM-dependent methyltransferase
MEPGAQVDARSDTGEAAAAPAGDVVCPVCDARTVRAFRRHGHWIRDCRGCGHRRAEVDVGLVEHVARVYDDAYFRDGRAGYADYLSEGDLLRARGSRYGELVARHVSPGRVLDVGAAAGFLLRGFADAGWTGLGIEPNAGMAEYGRRCLGVDIERAILESWRPRERFDCVAMIQVISHFVDPRVALAVAAECTRPGGVWLIEARDRESRTARLLGRAWHAYSPPSVLHWFSADGLCRLAGRFGRREIARGRLLKWVRGRHAAAVLRHHLEGTALAGIARRLLSAVPSTLALPYLADDLVWILFR